MSSSDDRAARLADDLAAVAALWRPDELAALATSRSPGRPQGRRPVPGPRPPVRVEVLDLATVLTGREDRQGPDCLVPGGSTPAVVLNAWLDWACDRLADVAIPPGLQTADDPTLAQPGNAARILAANLAAIVLIDEPDRVDRLARDVRQIANQLRVVHGAVPPHPTPCPRCGLPLAAMGLTLSCVNPGCGWTRTAPKLLRLEDVHLALLASWGDRAPAWSTVRGWAHRGRLTVIDRDADGADLFRLDQAVRLWQAHLSDAEDRHRAARARKAARRAARTQPREDQR
jgi:hypothetical protein